MCSQREYDRLKIQCTVDEVPVFSSKDASKLKEQLAEHTTYIMTEVRLTLSLPPLPASDCAHIPFGLQEDLSKRLAEKPLKQTSAVRKTILNMERHQALTSNDTERLAEIDAELALINKPSGQPREAAALLNEKNRKSNMEEVRRAEARGQDERRRQQEALAKGDASVKVDASARVKTVPRMNYDLRCAPFHISFSPPAPPCSPAPSLTAAPPLPSPAPPTASLPPPPPPLSPLALLVKNSARSRRRRRAGCSSTTTCLTSEGTQGLVGAQACKRVVLTASVCGRGRKREKDESCLDGPCWGTRATWRGTEDLVCCRKSLCRSASPVVLHLLLSLLSSSLPTLVSLVRARNHL